MDKVRKIFPRMILDTRELVKNRFYLDMHKNEDGSICLAGFFQYLGKSKKGWMKIKNIHHDGYCIVDTVSLADRNVISYNTNKRGEWWNNINYIRPILIGNFRSLPVGIRRYLRKNAEIVAKT